MLPAERVEELSAPRRKFKMPSTHAKTKGRAAVAGKRTCWPMTATQTIDILPRPHSTPRA